MYKVIVPIVVLALVAVIAWAVLFSGIAGGREDAPAAEPAPSGAEVTVY